MLGIEGMLVWKILLGLTHYFPLLPSYLPPSSALTPIQDSTRFVSVSLTLAPSMA